MAEKKINIRKSDMPGDMIQTAIDIAIIEIDKKQQEVNVAHKIKKEFDSQYGPCWHCIVGNGFGSSVSFDSNNCLFFDYGLISVLLFKAGSVMQP